MSGTLRLRGATSGYSELQAPAVAADQTFILPTAGGTLLTTDSPIAELTLALGSASAPSLRFEGDTDTGLYSSGTNTLNLVTGGSNRLNIDSSGNVLIGTTNAVAFGSRRVLALTNGTTGGVLSLYNSTTATANTRISSNPTGSEINDIGIHAASTNGSIIAYTNNDTERLRITSDGLVNITGGVQVTENITPTSGSGIEIFKPSGTSGQISAYNRGSSAWMDLILKGNTQQFHTNGSERLRIDSSGNCGIGNTNPATKLQVTGAVSCDDLLVNTTSAAPSSVATIRAASPQLSLYSTPGNTAYLNMGDTDDHDIGSIQYDNSSNALNFIVNASARMQINSSGNVGIGTTSPGQKFVVSGSSETNAKLSGAASTVGGYLYLQNTDTTDNNSMVIEGADAQGQGTSQIQFYNVSHTNNEGKIHLNTRPSGGSMASRLEIGNGTTTHQNNVNCNGNFSWDSTGSHSSPKATINSGTGTATFGPYDSSSNTGYGAQLNITANAGQLFTQIISTGSQYTDMLNVYFGSSKTFQVLANGNAQNTNNSYGAISDIKLKENIVDANSQWDDIKGIRVRNYNFIEGQTHTQIGVVAQEIETVSPGLVNEIPDTDAEGKDLGTTTKSVSYSVLYMKAIKALQEAMERIETLETEVAELKSN